MDSTRNQSDSLTLSQRDAVAARGNVLVMAGAGTGKTKTLVERCLDCLERDGAMMDELLIVTFTEAAAAEMRERLRRVLEARTQHASLNPQLSTLNLWQEQLARFDLAHIGTLHSFCLKLVREHFYELGLDPQLAILDEGEARQLANETLDEQFQSHYEGEDEFALAVQNLIQIHGGGRDEKICALILRLHNYSQTRPDAAGWLAQQRKQFAANEPADWRRWLLAAIANWRDEWLQNLGAPGTVPARSLPRAELAGTVPGAPARNEKAAELASILQRLKTNFTRELAAEVLEQIVAADDNWPAKRKTILRKPLEDLFDEAAFLAALAPTRAGNDPLAEDWSWVRGHMETLLRLAEEFAGQFAKRKLADGVLDFHDLEQFALKLLWNNSSDQPTAAAEAWRTKLKFVFVDEYQDINAAQDKIITALSRDSSPSPLRGERAGVRGQATASNRPPLPGPLLLLGGEGENAQAQGAPIGNRFLVGDVKQSIYRFRLADPKIFRDYARDWHGDNGQVIPLAENFRSREGLLNFVNSVCRLIMRGEIGGVDYDADAELKFGSPPTRADFCAANDAAPRVELLLRCKPGRNEPRDDEDGELVGLDETQKEARLVASHLKQLAGNLTIWSEEEKAFRPASFKDMAILLRSPRGKSEIFAQEFERAGVPLAVARGGFYQSAEILDLLSLLQLLDNPLQDVPCIAVLRSPLVGLSLDELAEIRLAAKDKHFWTALNRWGKAEGGKAESGNLFRKVNRFLERFSRWRKLAKQVSLSQCLEEILAETLYADWLRAQSRGAQRAANIASFLHLAQSFDQFQRQGLFRFLKFIEAQQEAEVEPEVPAVAAENAVRLMSIHQSKGLEFPVVVLADLAKQFNEQDLRSEIIFDEEFGPCPKVKPPSSGRRYPSLPHWLAQRRQKCELRGEELRLLYVALTRARDNLILTASITEKKWAGQWNQPQPVTARKIADAKSFADWLALWFGVRSAECGVRTETAGTLPELRWRIVADAELGDDFVCGSRGDEAQTKSGKQKAESKNKSEPVHDAGAPGTVSARCLSGLETGRDGARRSEHVGGCLDEASAERLRGVLTWVYPKQAATKRKAKSSVTELRRAAEEPDDEAEKMLPVSGLLPARRTRGDLKSQISNLKLSGAEVGAAHHKFLQHVALDKTGGLAAEADRLARENYLSADERAALDLDALAGFWGSPLGKTIQANAKDVRRELPFTARFSPAEIAEITGGKTDSTLADEFVVVQGVADLVVLLPQEIWLVDFKTDEVTVGGLAEKVKIYRPQLQLYAAALEKIFARKITLRALHFLALGRTEQI